MKNYLLFLSANIFFSAPSILLVLFYSHFGSVEDAARLGFSYGLLAPIQLLLSMQHSTSILSGGKDWHECVKQRTALGLLFLVVALLLAAAIGDWAVLALAFVRLADFYYEPRFYGQAKATDLRALWIEAAGRLLFFIVAISFIGTWGIGNLAIDLAALAVLNTGLAIFIVARTANWARASTQPSWWPDALLGAGAFAASLVVNVPRYFLGSGSPSELAFYSNMLTLILGGSLVYISLSNMLFARYTSAGRRGLLKYLKATGLTALAAIPLSLALFNPQLGASGTAVALFLGEKYLPFSGLVVYFAVFYVLLFLQHSLNSILIYLKRSAHVLFGNVLLLCLVAGTVWAFAEPTAKSVVFVTSVTTAIFLAGSGAYLYYTYFRKTA